MGIEIDLSGKVVLVTGGARGVGDGIVEVFLRAGADVEICGRTEPEQLRERDGRTVEFRSADVREPDQVRAWVDDVMGRRGRIDVVVNNAGGSPYANFVDGSPNFHRKINDLNFLAAAEVARAAYPHLRDSGSGVLLSVTSLSASRPSPGTALYGAAKAALESLTQSLAMEWAPDVRVNAVRAGLVATPGSADHYGDADQVARVAATIPRGRFATPEEIGNGCLLLASPLAAHISGAVLAIDGGGEIPSFLQHTPNA